MRFVEQHRTDYNYAPSIIGIGIACGIGKSTAQYHVRRLIDAGLLWREESLPRTLRLTPAGRAAIEEGES